MIPIRWIFRSRWAALLWAGGICWSAITFVGDHGGDVDAAIASDNHASVQSALDAEAQ